MFQKIVTKQGDALWVRQGSDPVVGRQELREIALAKQEYRQAWSIFKPNLVSDLSDKFN